MKIEGVRQVEEQLKRRASDAAKDSGSVLVGFTAAYAIYVHENLEMRLKGQPRPKGRGLYWDPQGKAGPKFLEAPARELSNSGELARVLTEVAKKSKSLMKGLLACGFRLLREAQDRVPVDTGNLKASGFVRREDK